MVIIEIIEILMLDKPLSESSRFRDEIAGAGQVLRFWCHGQTRPSHHCKFWQSPREIVKELRFEMKHVMGTWYQLYGQTRNLSYLYFTSDVPARLGLKATALAWLPAARAFEICRPGQSRQTRPALAWAAACGGKIPGKLNIGVHESTQGPTAWIEHVQIGTMNVIFTCMISVIR